MAERDETFLARWSRRKQAAREAEREPAPQRSAPQAPTGAADAAAPEADRTPALPDPATLDESSDFSVFLGKDVPVETQRAALRRLWRLDPIYNRVDGLDDYCADFSDRATVVQGLRTAYKVGRGMLEQIGDGQTPPDQTPTAGQSRDEPPPIAAGSAAPSSTPPDFSAQQSNPFAQQKEHEKPARALAERRPRPLPKRG